MSTPMTGNREFRDEVVRVASLTVVDVALDGYTFNNCQILGPAVLALMNDITLNNCIFEADINAIFW